MLDSNKKYCSVCGSECGISRFKIRNDGVCCRSCFDRAGFTITDSLEDVSALDIANRIRGRAPDGNNTVYGGVMSGYENSNDGKPTMQKSRIIKISIAAAFLLVCMVSMIVSSVKSKPSNVNIGTVKECINVENAKEIVNAFYKTGVINDEYKISESDIVKSGVNEYDINLDVALKLITDGKSFKMYTYNSKFNINSAILLYDSEKPKAYRMLNSSELTSIKRSQRKYFVENTVQINMKNYSLTVENTGTKDIANINIFFGPSGEGNSVFTYYYNTERDLAPGERQVHTMLLPGATESYKITRIVVHFKDNTQIELDEFDAQFL